MQSNVYRKFAAAKILIFNMDIVGKGELRHAPVPFHHPLIEIRKEVAAQ
jgi:hypothetical protein